MMNRGYLASKSVRLLSLLPAAIATCVVCFTYKDQDYEVNMTKHYSEGDSFYGGYGRHMYHCADGYKLQHYEASVNVANVVLMTETGKAPHFFSAHDGGGRLLCGSFLPSLVWRFLLGHGDIKCIYWITGILLYLLITAAAFALARLYFENHYSGCAAALISAFYPLHRVCFNQIKVQDGFVLLLLVELLLLELLLRSKCRASMKFVVLTCTMFLGGFATPANYMLWAVLTIRFVFALFSKSQRGNSFRLLIPVAALIVATHLAAEFRASHEFSAKFWDISRQIQTTKGSFQKFMRTHDWHDIRIMKYSVEGVASLLKVVGDGIWKTNPTLIALFLVFPFIWRQHMWLWASAFPVLALGQTMTLITGWIFYYGYMSGAGTMIAIVLVGGVLGRWISGRTQNVAAAGACSAPQNWTQAAIAAVALVAVCFSFARPNNLYVGNLGGYDTDKDVYAIYGQCVKKIY